MFIASRPDLCVHGQGESGKRQNLKNLKNEGKKVGNVEKREKGRKIKKSHVLRGGKDHSE